jgi:hypothetical protein
MHPLLTCLESQGQATFALEVVHLNAEQIPLLWDHPIRHGYHTGQYGTAELGLHG